MTNLAVCLLNRTGAGTGAEEAVGWLEKAAGRSSRGPRGFWGSALTGNWRARGQGPGRGLYRAAARAAMARHVRPGAVL